jgi:biopolymer transport protein ExbD
LAFKRQKARNRMAELISLIDVVFLLLIFFLVTSLFIPPSSIEYKLHVPTPDNRPGKEAQILIQLLGEGRYLWIDEHSVDVIERAAGGGTSGIKRGLLRSGTINDSQLQSRLEALLRKAGRNAQANYFVVVRCPNEIPYFRVINIINTLLNSGRENIKCGCVGGSIEDISRINVAERGTRRNIEISY